MTDVSYAECVVCHAPIIDARDAMIVRDDSPSEDSPGRVEYRHPDCDPRDRERGGSTVVEF